MHKNLYLIDMPDFRVTYEPKVNYGYKNMPGKNLKKLLQEKSENHCMYCYALLENDRSCVGEIEHSIEKTLSNYLLECVPNLALVCRNCNISLKRRGEKGRKIYLESAIKDFEYNLNCSSINCKTECMNYQNLKKKYIKNAKLILQPNGIWGRISKLDYRLQYDIVKAEFIPSRKYKYDHEDLDFIEYHVGQFRLNDPKYKTKALIHFVEDTINADGMYIKRKNSYPNYIVDLFVRKLNKLTKEEVLELCEDLYVQYQLLCLI